MTTAPVVTITDEIVAELERLSGSATGGDWEYRLGLIRTQHESDGYVPVAVAPNDPKNWRDQRDLNMEYIAAANPQVIAAILQERASLLADARRIDWLERQFSTCTVYMDGQHPWSPNSYKLRELRGPTFRIAIDHAM